MNERFSFLGGYILLVLTSFSDPLINPNGIFLHMLAPFPQLRVTASGKETDVDINLSENLFLLFPV